jgi:uroporphyrinogen-III decarboxylase
MTERERYIQTILFQQPDKVPLMTMGPRKSTIERWQAEGLPKDQGWMQAALDAVGVKYDFPKQQHAHPGVDFRMIPMFEEKVLAHKDGHYIVQDWMGNITEISDEFDYTYIRNAIDFVTRKWHKFPVETRADFEEMKQRYNPDESGRFPDDFAARCERLKERDYVLRIGMAGPFWQLREWCGFEPLCMMFIEDPAFIREMVAFWTDFVAAVLERLLDGVTPDCILVNEDMAYKGASMISPAMVREFLLPTWQRWGRLVRAASVPVYDVDSDGNVDELIPLFIEGGFQCCDPIEVAAGCDLVAYRERFGTRMAYTGGIDKRIIAKGGSALEEEFARVLPVVQSGGYIPGCDHGMPPDISWDCCMQFCRLWAEVCGWLRR